MSQKRIFTLLLVVLAFFIFYLLQNSYKQHKIQAANKDIENFYSELNERYIGDYFQIQGDLHKLFSNHELTKIQKERLLFTQDSLRIEFAKLMKTK